MIKNHHNVAENEKFVFFSIDDCTSVFPIVRQSILFRAPLTACLSADFCTGQPKNWVVAYLRPTGHRLTFRALPSTQFSFPRLVSIRP